MSDRIYAFRIKDKDDLHNSSSGGAFTAISNFFLKNHWPIVCSSYNYENNQMEFSIITTQEERNKSRGSKYFQSNPLNSYKEAIMYLKQNPEKQLLFVGMGCQAEGFRKLSELLDVRDRTTIVDIICTGVPSPEIWKDYITKKGKVEYLTFKDKRNGWNAPSAYVMCNDKENSIADFVKLFYSHNALRPSCYECKFAKIKRDVDITIGDFWHIENSMPDFMSNEGNSLIICHTKNGQNIFNIIKECGDWRESNYVDCMQNMLSRPTPRPASRDEFWFDYQNRGISFILKKYEGASLMTKIKRKTKFIIKQIFGGGGTN